MKRSILNAANNKIDKDFALLYGVLLGDGCLSKCENKYFISIAGNKLDDIPFYEEILSPLLLKFRGKPTKIKFRSKQNSIEFNFSDKNLFYKFYNMGFPIGKKGTLIAIPKIFYSKNLIKYIVQGIIATDGSLVLTKNQNKYYPRLELVVTHKYLIKQVYSYLISKGMKGHLYLTKRKPNPRWKTQLPQYRFQFNGKSNLDRFRIKIGFINPKQENKFNLFTDYSNKYDNSILGIPTQYQKHYRLQNLNATDRI